MALRKPEPEEEEELPADPVQALLDREAKIRNGFDDSVDRHRLSKPVREDAQ